MREDLSRAQAWRVRWADRRDLLGEDQPANLRRATRLAAGQGFVLTTRQAAAAEVDHAQVRRLLRSGRWSAPRRGVLAVISPLDERDRAALAAAAVALVRATTVISHRSAAILHGLPVVTMPPIPDVTAPAGTRASTASIRLWRAGLDQAEISRWHGSSVTGVARTVADLSRIDRGWGLVAADAAIADRLMTDDALWAAVSRCAGWPGAAGMRWVADRADGGSESPLESLTRGCLLAAGLPAPRLQVRIDDAAGFVGRVDMLWPDERVIVEADGRLKYQKPRDVWDEKKRHDRLVRLGFVVERVIWSDVQDHPARTVTRIREALASDR
jgi:hypothetical protein